MISETTLHPTESWSEPKDAPVEFLICEDETFAESFIKMIAERKERESFVVRVTCDRQAFY